jgi:hypothetical protein
MKLILRDEDLRPEFQHLNPSQIKFKHFLDNVQECITAVGQALYRNSTDDGHAAIYPPKKKEEKVKTVVSKKPVAVRFEKDDSEDTFQSAYMNGYDFGDTVLENVSFRVDILSDGRIRVGIDPLHADYFKDLNEDKWLAEALRYACSDCEEFREFEGLKGGRLYMVRIGE